MEEDSILWRLKRAKGMNGFASSTAAGAASKLPMVYAKRKIFDGRKRNRNKNKSHRRTLNVELFNLQLQHLTKISEVEQTKQTDFTSGKLIPRQQARKL